MVSVSACDSGALQSAVYLRQLHLSASVEVAGTRTSTAVDVFPCFLDRFSRVFFLFPRLPQGSSHQHQLRNSSHHKVLAAVAHVGFRS